MALRVPKRTSVSVKAPGSYGIHDSLRHGLASARDEIAPTHPLELSERRYRLDEEEQLFQVLRETQGLALALELQAERKLASTLQRLPPLPNSNLSLDVLLGTCGTMTVEKAFKDVGAPVSVDGRAVMEKRLNLLHTE